jgi:hypothetical protein
MYKPEIHLQISVMILHLSSPIIRKSAFSPWFGKTENTTPPQASMDPIPMEMYNQLYNEALKEANWNKLVYVPDE